MLDGNDLRALCWSNTLPFSLIETYLSTVNNPEDDFLVICPHVFELSRETFDQLLVDLRMKLM